ncbi:MAG: DNA mismatch repair endonuclease MutL [Bacilli bacterium]|nr:DNA mismatch repair endonuclease MutL [Bacilli bacterium]
MGVIQIMSPSLANKIAAGEVVERPMSVVKELVENAIDAGSTKIDIYLEQAGITSIKVIDNGSGMVKEDALLAFERHATSKLRAEVDLFRISSLGFRGEALPSIASVSDVTLITSTGEDLGTLVHYRAGKLVETGTAASKKGTEVTVKSLFFNTPARLKYLKAENTELSYTIDYINKMAIAHPDIAFKLVNNNRILLETYGNNNIIQVLANIYGLEVAKMIDVIDYRDGLFTLKLYYTTPEINRTTRNYITITVNKRLIRNNELTKAVLEGYETYLPINRYPIAVLDITVDPLLVDVNVHPAKLEVRLSNQEHIKTVITELIQKKLKDLMYVPKVVIREPFIEKQEVNVKQEEFDFTNQNNERDEVKELFTDKFTLKETDIKMDTNNSTSYIRSEPEYEIREEKAVVKTPKLPKLYYIGQLLGTYLLAQNED